MSRHSVKAMRGRDLREKPSAPWNVWTQDDVREAGETVRAHTDPTPATRVISIPCVTLSGRQASREGQTLTVLTTRSG